MGELVITGIFGLLSIGLPIILSFLISIYKTGKVTHALVNSSMGAQLKLNSVVSRRLAELTKDSLDIEAANLAEKLYQEHEHRQTIADKK